jgi:enoyl-CoA hydratase/carnithine racemase
MSIAGTLAARDFKYIQFQVQDYVARLILNHPPYNVLTVPMMAEMAEAIESLNGHNEVKCIVLESSQRTFCAGISLEDSKPDRVFQTLDAFNHVF